jgi:transposase InsO family protein
MPIINLFLALFTFMLFCFTHKKRLLHVLFIQSLAIKALSRTLAQHNIRPACHPYEKYLIASLFEDTPHADRFFTLVSTKTILTVWKNIFSKHWSHPHKTPGRPPLSKAVKTLILKLKQENILWGARRIRDELKKLRIEVSHETISKILRRFRKTGALQPTLSWKRFLSAHWNSLFACDFFTATTFSMVTWYVFFIMELKTRKIVQYGITTNPTTQFLRNQFSEFEYEYPEAMLIHDNSGELRWFPYERYHIKDVRIVPYSPDMNAYAERFVRSIRQECLDYFIIFSQGQLRRIIKSYIDYYNNYRPHQGLKGIPNGPPEQGSKTGRIKQKRLLFGLHNHYYREAA